MKKISQDLQEILEKIQPISHPLTLDAYSQLLRHKLDMMVALKPLQKVVDAYERLKEIEAVLQHNINYNKPQKHIIGTELHSEVNVRLYKQEIERLGKQIIEVAEAL